MQAFGKGRLAALNPMADELQLMPGKTDSAAGNGALHSNARMDHAITGTQNQWISLLTILEWVSP